MRRSLSIAVGCGLVGLGAAWAQGQLSSSMVSDRACQDGSLGCVVEGEELSVGPVKDAAGRMMPSGARLGFFDLQPLPAFSVHGGLSVYGAEEVPQAAEPEPEPEPDRTADDMGFEDGLAEAEPVQPDQGWNDPLFEPDRQTTQPIQSSGSSTAASPSTGSGGPSGRAPDVAAVVSPPPPRDPPPTRPPVTRPAPEPQEPEPVAALPPADCEDLRQLEGAALLGALSEAHLACLETRIGSESSQTEKNKISRVLLVNAEASSNGDWPRLMRRHLEDIDRSDPDMCLKYALHLSKKRGTSSAHGVIRWADNALERKSRWSGPTYTRRVYDLHKLRAHAANRLWQRANEDLLNAGADREELAGKEEGSRARAKSLAREWLDFARATSQNTSEAMALCVSTAGSKKFCKE